MGRSVGANAVTPSSNHRVEVDGPENGRRDRADDALGLLPVQLIAASGTNFNRIAGIADADDFHPVSDVATEAVGHLRGKLIIASGQDERHAAHEEPQIREDRRECGATLYSGTEPHGVANQLDGGR